ncbi:hypothetical protein DPMN_175808 [Dreissena polymorpha]|uniref:Uncharacterized protein n=1 Tax=Dreissena polymorpha TaxID=45954 RepID=A0A9D4IGD8_DREPO|nr:hypothetical protein DPMN_175808 [Dreissena polymorpha]
MNSIKASCEELKKIALQMTGLATTISVGGMTKDKMTMLNELNDSVNSHCNLIVGASGKINQALEDSHAKVSCLRKDLQSSKKGKFDVDEKNKNLQKQLDEMKVDLNDSKQLLDGVLDENFDEDDSLIVHSEKEEQDRKKESDARKGKGKRLMSEEEKNKDDTDSVQMEQRKVRKIKENDGATTSTDGNDKLQWTSTRIKGDDLQEEKSDDPGDEEEH